MTGIAFVCVGNAGRSQMAAALAERARDERELNVDIVSGGVDPAERIDEAVLDALRERDIDIGDRTPRAIRPADIEDVEYVVTMGCSVEQFRPAEWDGETQRWELDAPSNDVRAQRDEIDRRVTTLFDSIEAKR